MVLQLSHLPSSLGPLAFSSYSKGVHLLRYFSKRLYSSSSEFDKLGQWDTQLDFPLMEESSIKRGTPIPEIKVRDVGISSVIGRRNYQEDFYTIKQLRNNLLLLGVWDGHGGESCAKFCSENVEKQLERLLARTNEDDDLNLGLILSQLIYSLNHSFEVHWIKNKNNSSGSTATLALIHDGYELVIAHVGDSRAILCRDGVEKTLTLDHCPSRPDEKKRIKSLGGTVTADEIGRYLVNKRLSMSRSIGDFELRRFGVISDPDITRLRIKHSKDQFLALVTDGVTFALSDKEIVETVKSFSEPQEAADRLVDQALLYGSEDNLTVLILPLGVWGKDQSKASNFFSLGRSLNNSYRFG
ncbi:protein phosphatase Mn(2+)-dependent 1K [Lepeophtheirus salmonis]|uniref:Protein phosphatase 1K, mitochondrial n=2 Tax=Lepeophtheirus salmonis TaxID=72036 RepID=D3PGW0_LEPSM|nr:protein phosphatase 1K, mitochondrial-like [Lepeophtheirus salmonis]ADD24506.1 Protein phosphatase 1K, mitochondrial [Lepeophtheirus salmonis]